MNRTIRAIFGIIFVLIITFSAISIFQNIGKGIKADITGQKIYTLSQGTKAILAKLNQPIKVKLYYAKTAAMKGPDQIRYYNNYYQFVKTLLEEYAAEAKGMVDLQVIDPRPYSEEESQALAYGLKRFAITEEENFFFGMVVQTQFGVEKSIPFFSPDRQNFVEYDISYLIDNAVTRQKTRLGILSSLPVMGDNVTGYMAQMMRMQGQQPRPSWTIVRQLQKQYEVKNVATDVNEIDDVDILLIVHPKKLSDKTLFAIDQYILKGGRAIICVDPHCVIDQPDPMAMQRGRPASSNSDLNKLIKTWGLEMPQNKFAGDRSLAIMASLTPNARPQKIIGVLELVPGCFNADNVITTDLNQVRMLFSGVLEEKSDSTDSEIERTPLLTTTNRGNGFVVHSAYELMTPDPSRLMAKFIDGTKAVVMGYQVTGKFKSAFPDGIEIEVESEKSDASEKAEDANEPKTIKKQIKGLAEAAEDCAVVIFADVDFISDIVAYQNSFFGKMVIGDNSTLLLNAIDDLSGSSELVSIRSRGNFKRPFTRVDEIELQAEAETAEEMTKVNAEIAGFNRELQSILASAKQGEEEVVGSSILQKRRQFEVKIRQAERDKQQIQLKRRQRIDSLGRRLQNANSLAMPAVILIIAVVLGIRRGARKRHYISHTSDS